MTAIGAAVTPEIWRPQIWTPGREWRPKPLPKFSIRSWRKAKEEAITNLVGIKQPAGQANTGSAGTTTVAPVLGSAATAGSKVFVFVCCQGSFAAPFSVAATGYTFFTAYAANTASLTFAWFISNALGSGTTFTCTSTNSARLAAFVCEFAPGSGLTTGGNTHQALESASVTSESTNANVQSDGFEHIVFGLTFGLGSMGWTGSISSPFTQICQINLATTMCIWAGWYNDETNGTNYTWSTAHSSSATTLAQVVSYTSTTPANPQRPIMRRGNVAVMGAS